MVIRIGEDQFGSQPNFLLVEALQRFYLYYGPDLKVECPKGSGDYLNLAQCAQEIQHRLIRIFAR